MLAATAKTKRFLETVQLGLSFVSVCAVLDASRIPVSPDRQPGYYAGIPFNNGAAEDRRLGDLARADRKRREAEQQGIRRGIDSGGSGGFEARREPA
jgi:hypothetical protein